MTQFLDQLEIVYVNLNLINHKFENEINAFLELHFAGFRKDNPLCDKVLVIKDIQTDSIISALSYQNCMTRGVNKKIYTTFAAFAVVESRRKQKIGFLTIFALLLYAIERRDSKLTFCANHKVLGFYKKVSDILKIDLYYQFNHLDEALFYFDIEKVDPEKVKKKGLNYLLDKSFIMLLHKYFNISLKKLF